MAGDNDASASTTPKKHTFACVRCSERKVKCDRQDPCNACLRHNAECIFRVPKPPRRRRHQSKEETFELLKRYEVLLRTHGIDPNQRPGFEVRDTIEARIAKSSSPGEINASTEDGAAHLPTPASSTFSESKQFFKPQLLHGQSGTKFVDNSLWSRVAQEMRDAEDSLDEEESTDEATDLEEQHHSLLPVFNHASPSSPPSHPPPAMIRRLWKIFKENVNPLFKIIHVPTFQQALERAITDLDHVPRQFEALMFAIYSTAILSISAEECKQEFGTSRSTLARRFNIATQTALTRAKFMSTTSLVVLQALLLYLISIRDEHEPRAIWNLTGLVIRIAEGMGMRIDGAQLGLPPFESEMRRRLWWQISVHDFRCAEMCGQAKIRMHETEKSIPEVPTNVNDADLHPAMTSPPTDATGATEMLWVMFRSELSGFARGQLARMKRAGVGPSVSPEEFLIMDDLDHKDRVVKQVEDLMETKYLRYCDPTQPLHLFTLLATRSAIKLMRFMCHHPRRWIHLTHVPDEEKELVWEHAVAVAEYYQMMQTTPALRPFQWNVPYFIQWHIFIHILDTLRAAPCRPDAEKAWRLIDSIYEHNAHILLSTHRPVFMAVGNLCLKAVDAREQAAVARDGIPRPVWPEYVHKLREQREAARSRRAAAAAGSGDAQCVKSRDDRVKNAGGDMDVEADVSTTANQTTVEESYAGQSSTGHLRGPPRSLQQGLNDLSFSSDHNDAGNDRNQSHNIHQRFAFNSNSNSNSNNKINSNGNSNPGNVAQWPAATARGGIGNNNSNSGATDNYWFTNATSAFHHSHYSHQLDNNDLGMGMGMGIVAGMGMGNGIPTAGGGGGGGSGGVGVGFGGDAADADMLDFDPDAILAQGFSLDTPNGQVVDWAQWDSFFGGGAASATAGGGGGGGGGG